MRKYTEKHLTKSKIHLQNLPLDQSFIKIFSMFGHFLNSDNIRIQFKAVECMAYIFNHNWMNSRTTAGDFLTLTNVHEKLCKDICSQRTEILPAHDTDTKSTILAVRAQFYCTIIANCSCLRKKMWFRLFELCCIDIQTRKGIQLQLRTTNKLSQTDAKPFMLQT